jgi:hypothetical protein
MAAGLAPRRVHVAVSVPGSTSNITLMGLRPRVLSWGIDIQNLAAQTTFPDAEQDTGVY